MFTVWRALAHLPGAAGAVRNPVVRTLALAGAFGRPWKIPPDVAAGDVLNLRRCDMSRTMQALAGERFTGGQTMTAPLTVVLGGRDPLIRRRHLDLAQLPPQTAVIRLPGAGHVPTWDAPEAITRELLSA